MSQFLVDLRNDYGLFEIAVYALLCGLGLRMLCTRLNTRCPDCGSRFKKTDEENTIFERTTHSIVTHSHIDPALPVTSFYRYIGCGFESKRLDRLTKSNDSKSAGSK